MHLLSQAFPFTPFSLFALLQVTSEQNREKKKRKQSRDPPFHLLSPFFMWKAMGKGLLSTQLSIHCW